MKYFIVVITLILSTIGWSQSMQFLFRGKVENIDLNKPEGGVTISIVQGGSAVASASSASNGKYTLKGTVNYSQPFDVVFSKSGLVSKKVAFDFSSLNEEDTPASAEFQPIEALDMSLFKERKDVDFSFLNTEPVAAFTWNERSMEANLDGGVVSRMRTKIEALLNDAESAAAKLEADYQAAIRAGDDAFAKKEYENALASFEAALGFKPNEKYPAGKILELDALIKAQKSAELAEKQEFQEYYNLIEAADNLKKAGNLEKAVSTYKEASAKRPTEQYPKDQIDDIEEQIAAKNQAAENEAAYLAAIKAGDVFMKQNSLRAARDKFEEATKLKPLESYPKEKLKEIETKMTALEEQEALKKKYTEAIAAADKLYTAEDFQAAKAKYSEALTYESASAYAKGRVALCDEALAKSKAEQERLAKIQELLAKGNADLTAEKYTDAITAYTGVLALDDKNAEATTKLAQAQAKVEELANAAEREKQYNALILEGDQANTAKKLDLALTKYEAAKAVKETPEVQVKITEVQNAINLAKSEADKAANYKALIADAESKFGSDDLQGAIDKYTEAGKIDPSKPEPAKKITEIQKILDTRNADKAKADQFAALLKQGNDLMAANDLENAKTKFQEASNIDPLNQEPKTKIKEIDKLIAQNQADKLKQDQFASLMKEGTDLMAANDLEKAKAKFQQASTLDATKPEPKAKIVEIDELIAKNLADKANQEKQAKLQTAIDAADKLFNEAKWENAQLKYREALVIDPANDYANDRISQIDVKIAEAKKQKEVEALLAEAKVLYDSKKVEKARTKYQEVLTVDPSNTVATTRIDEINQELAALQNEEQKLKAFTDLKAEGTKLYAENKLPEARQKFTEALSFKSDAGVQQTIVDIDKAIEKNKELAAQAEQQAAIDKQYADFISKAEASETSKDYASAIASYQKASGVKPSETLPKNKIKELTDLMAQIQANSSLNEQYANFIKEAESFEASEDYTAAIASYKKAGGVKPAETLPKTKVAELTALMETNAANQAAIDKKYTAAMNRGEAFMTSKDYLNAITAFNEALELKPTEKEPALRAAAAEEAERGRDSEDVVYKKILTVTEEKIAAGDYDKAEELITRAKTLRPEDKRPEELLDQVKALRLRDKKYNELMAAGEVEAGKNNYSGAIAQFEKAKSLIPSEALPSTRIDEMNRLLNDASSTNQKETLYKSYMDQGQAAMTGEKFVEALGYYQNALSVKIGDQIAQDRVNEVQQILDDLANANQAELEKKNQFDVLIKEADKLFAEGNYLDAKAKYDEALNVDPYSSYAKTKGDECARLVANIGKQEAEEQYQKLLSNADKSFEEKNWTKAKDYYNRALNMRNADPYPKKKLKEIDLIENPPIAESQKLESLGEEYNGTLDGGFVIQSAEDQRKFDKGVKIQNELDKASVSQTAIATQNQTERLDTQNEMYGIWEKVAETTEGANDSREASIEELRSAEQIRKDNEIRDDAFEKGENLAAQEQLNSSSEKFILDYMQGDETRRESTEAVKAVQTSEQDEILRQGTVYVQRKYDADQVMNQVSINAEAQVKDDYLERLEIEKSVDAASDETAGIYKTLDEGKYDNIQREKAGIELIQSNVAARDAESNQIARYNNEEVKSIRSEANNVALAYMQQDDENGKETYSEMEVVRSKVISDNEGFDKVRVEATDRLKGIQSDFVEQEIIASAGQSEKYLTNKQQLTEEEEKRREVDVKAVDDMGEKIAYVKEKDRQAFSVTSQGQLSDEEERLNAKQQIENQEIAKSAKSQEDIDEHVESTENLKDVKKANDSKQDSDGIVQRDKNLGTQQDLNKIDNAPKEKVTIANSLGQEYPEGVSQETFTRKDEAGLITTVITRRIVVIDGHADVYVRTQTKNGITYSKNDIPSLQHVWNSETQGPDLVRHY